MGPNPDRQTLIAQGLSELELTLDANQVAALDAYAQIILKWNKTTNLISRQDVGRFVPRHLLDSMSILPWLSSGPVADVGSGGGLPGIPLAIAKPDTNFVLLERSARKVRFLKQVVRELTLDNVTPIATDVADYANAAGAGAFAHVVSRAVMPAIDLWALASPLLHQSADSQSSQMILHEATASSAVLERQTDEFGQEVVLERHSVALPGLQSQHQILILSRRK